MYFLTGASTERQAVLAYNQINRGMQELDETAISETIITPIKQQEPGHFAFYQMSATAMIQDKVLRPWQLFLTRVHAREVIPPRRHEPDEALQGRHGRSDG